MVVMGLFDGAAGAVQWVALLVYAVVFTVVVGIPVLVVVLVRSSRRRSQEAAELRALLESLG
jgi:flagellar basal body-associated protein FliL